MCATITQNHKGKSLLHTSSSHALLQLFIWIISVFVLDDSSGEKHCLYLSWFRFICI